MGRDGRRHGHRASVAGAVAVAGGLAGRRRGLAGRAVAVILGLNLLSFLTAAPACRFPSDHRRPERRGRAVAGFFRDVRRVARDPNAGGRPLLAAAGSGGTSDSEGRPLVAGALASGGRLGPDRRRCWSEWGRR